MKTQNQPSVDSFALHTQEIAQKALMVLAKDSQAYKVAWKAKHSVCINYMRCREFQGVLEQLEIEDGAEVLDISSPQWFTLCLAYLFPKVQFHYTNIIESEIEDYIEIAKAANLNNIKYTLMDIRSVSDSIKYDLIYSISVLEHVYPEEGGDIEAYSNIKKLLNPNGRVVITVPYKEKAQIIYQKGAVYERDGEELKFFAREYDKQTYESLEKATGFIASSKKYIIEKHGLFAMDYYEWGAGSKLFSKKIVLNLAKVMRKCFGGKFDSWVAKKYYRLDATEDYRLVNIVATYDQKNL